MKDQSLARFWTTLEALQRAALAGGCTQAQFSRAVEIVGDDPKKVASYLERHNFFVPNGIISQP